MKTKIAKLLIPCLTSLVCLTGCGHEHTYDTSRWMFNEEQHWHAANCGHNYAIDIGTHSDGDGDGMCDVCTYLMSTPDPGPDPTPQEEIERYYSKYDLELEGPDLEQELQKICFDTHRVYWRYSDYYSAASYTKDHISSEAAPNKVGQKLNEYFYTGKTATGVGTREHVWPCANSAGLWVHGDSSSDPHNIDSSHYAGGGGSDLYHIRPSTSSVNTARGNSKFVDFDDDEMSEISPDQIVEVGDSGPYKIKIYGAEKTKTGYQYAQKVEVPDEYKGDVARILVYVWIHYAYRGNYYGHQDMIGSLDLCNVLGYNSDRDRTLEVLCEWNRLDKPSATEQLRNKTVQGLQGNRNPFVDYPELMDRLFGFEE